MTARVSASGASVEVQGEMPAKDRLTQAMSTFLREFGATAAIHMESCVRCGLCAQACHFYITMQDPNTRRSISSGHSSRPITGISVRSRCSTGFSASRPA